MTQQRSEHKAALLDDGRVLISGGFTRTFNENGTGIGEVRFLNSSEIFNPSAQSWTLTESMSEERGGHIAIVLPAGKILVAGGRTLRKDTETDELTVIYHHSVELYDHASGQWSSGEDMIESRWNSTATLMKDGRVLLSGGEDSNGSLSTSEIYDPVTGLWSATGRMLNPRSGHSAVLLSDGKVLVVGGAGDKVEIFDPQKGIWSAVSSLSQRMTRQGMVLMENGQIITAGGFGSTGPVSTSELYDPDTQNWTRIPGMSVTRVGPSSILLGNGNVLVVGGSRFAASDLYNPVAGEWISSGNMLHGRKNQTATLLQDGRVLVSGGERRDRVILSTVEIYSP